MTQDNIDVVAIVARRRSQIAGSISRFGGVIIGMSVAALVLSLITDVFNRGSAFSTMLTGGMVIVAGMIYGRMPVKAEHWQIASVRDFNEQFDFKAMAEKFKLGYLADALAWAVPTRSVYFSFSAGGKTYQSSRLTFMDDEFLQDDAGNVQIAFDPKFPRVRHVVLTTMDEETRDPTRSDQAAGS